MFKKIQQNFNVAFFGMATAIFAFSSLPNEAAAQNAERNSLALEEIVVTARKKSESIQDVPLAVTAITDQLREGSVRRLEDIQAFAPNLFISSIKFGYDTSTDSESVTVQFPIYVPAIQNAINNL